MSQQIPASALEDPAFLSQPALPPPPGVIPNFKNPEYHGPTLVIVGAVLLALVVLALANRAYTKIWIVRKASWDDLTVSLAALGAVAWYTLCILQNGYGVIGKHLYEVRLGAAMNQNFGITYATLTLNGPILWVTKLTFFLLYLQIFRPMRWLRICIYLGATLSTIFYWSASAALFALSLPNPGETWLEFTISPRFRLSSHLNLAIAVGGLLVDVYLFILPITAIQKVQLHGIRKVGLTIMFSTGLTAVVASAVSIYFRFQLIHSDDKSWTGLNFELLSLVELDMGIITACMPSFAKVLHQHLPPWATLKTRMKLIPRASPSEDPKRELVTVHKHLRPTHFDRHQEDSVDIGTTDSDAAVELESLNSVKDHSGETYSDPLDDERRYLKQHDI